MSLELSLATSDDQYYIVSESQGSSLVPQPSHDTVDITDIADEWANLPLPYDFPRLPQAARHYQTISVEFSLLLEFVAQHDSEWLTPGSLLLAAFTALLYRYTQQDLITIDCTSLSSQQVTDALPKTAVAAILSLEDALSISCLAKQAATWLTRASHGCSDASTSLHSAVAFTYIEQAIAPPKAPIADNLIAWDACLAQSQADLHLLVFWDGQHLKGCLEYDPSRFRSATVERLAGHLNQVIAGSMVDLDVPIAALPLLTPAEEQQFNESWGSQPVDYPRQPIFFALEHHALERPDKIAIRVQNQHLTYVDLNRRANQLAHYLIQMGIESGVHVASCLEPSLHVLVSILAIFKVGGVYVPLDPSHPAERLTAILDDTLPPLVLTQTHLTTVLPTVNGRVICLDADWPTIVQQPDHNPNCPIDIDQTAYIIYTSGTTGKPKGVMTSHANLINYIWAAQSRYRFTAEDVMPAMARFTFSITMFELWSPLVAGGTLLLLNRDHILDANRMVTTIQQVTVVHMSPSLLRKLIAHIDDTGIDIQSFGQLKHISSGGDFVSADLLEAMKRVFPAAEVYVIYGCSEISCMGCTYLAPRDQTLTKSKVGKPFSNVTVYLLDPNKRRVPVGVVGEIHFGGAGVTQGYLDQSILTQSKFITVEGQRLYCTGDLGRFDIDGNLEILGRSDYQIKLRGIRIEPGDIEATLRQAPGIRESVVVARQLPGKQEKSLVAYIVKDPSSTQDLLDMRRFLQTKLPDYMVPSAFVVLEALPVNINQKVDRKALPAPTQQDLVSFKPFVAPRSDCEATLTHIWQRVLDVQPIGVEDNFFDIGGDSLQSVELMVAIEKTFGKMLPLSTLLTEPTIAQLADILQDNKPSDLHKSVVPLKRGGSKPPIFFIHDGEGETLLYRNLALSLDAEHPVYGIQPYSQDNFPILHTRLDDIVAYYTEQIRTIQPEGPYLLSGLCIGGFIAFEVARNLRRQGQTVKMIALLDAAVVNLPVRPGRITSQRFDGLSKALANHSQANALTRSARLVKVFSKKAMNLIAYEITSRAEVFQAQAKMRLLRYCLDRGLPLPRFLRHISVTTALHFAEKEYVPGVPYSGEVLLFLATQRSSAFDGTEIDDTPYREIYSDPLLGWQRLAETVTLHEMPGGHSSMLQSPNVDVLAKTIQTYLDTVL